MFEAKRTVVYIQKNKIKVVKIALGKTPKIIRSSDYEWDEQSLDRVFNLIKKDFGRKVRFLISENKSYLASFSFPKDIKDIKNKVSEKVKESFPLELDQIVFDWKELAIDKEKKVIQAFALPRQFFQNLSTSANKAGLKIQAFEPISYSLARLTLAEKEAHLILFNNGKALGAAVFNGAVLMSTMLEKFLTIKDMVRFVKEKFNLEIKKAVVSGELREDLRTILSSLKIEMIQQALNPMFSLALKSDLKGKDARVLNLEPLKNSPLDKKT